VAKLMAEIAAIELATPALAGRLETLGYTRRNLTRQPPETITG